MKESFLYRMACFSGGFMGGIIVENSLEGQIMPLIESNGFIPPYLVRPFSMLVFGLIGGLISVRMGQMIAIN